MSHIWSPQQQAFLDWAVDGSGSCVLVAVAGAGKTTVLLEAAARMPGQVAVLSYNRDIATENKAKLEGMGVDWKKAQAGTVHSFGFKPLRKLNPNIKVDEYKVANIIERLITPQDALWIYRSETAHLVDLAKQMALGVTGGAISDKHVWLEMAEHFDVFDHDDENPPVDDIITFAQQVLIESNKDFDVIDYSDMVYLPILRRLRMWQYDVVMVDEAQDTNAARRALVRALLRKGGRCIAVGDPAQAIYGFTGADSDSLDLIKHDFNAIELPLTTTFRCPKAVVSFAQRWVNHIQAAPEAPEGSVAHINMTQFITRNDLNGTAAVLSRTNKPLVALAFKLIRKRIPCKIEGRDIGNGIVKLIQRWKINTLDALEKRLDLYLAHETTKLLAKKKESKLAEIEDQVETIHVIIDQCRSEGKYTVADATAYVKGLFGDQVKNMLVLSSIHKAKGREWERVFWLDRAGTCPSKWARQAWQQAQESHLCYVAATRSKDQLIEVSPLEEAQKEHE